MLKRLMDILASLLGLLALSPLFLVLALLVKLHDGGSVFYRASRVGRYGKEFKLFKFRSMVQDADKLGAALTSAGDSRVTPIGRFLRKSKVDELPQLLNVLLGDMSLVGPRPESPKYAAFYNEEQRKVLEMRPGMTSLASIVYRNEESLLTGDDWEQRYIEEIMPKKLAMDLEYYERQSLLLDIQIILKTIAAIIF